MRYSIALAACLLAPSAAAQDIRITDGDTFEMDGEVIRHLCELEKDEASRSRISPGPTSSARATAPVSSS